MSDYSHRSAGCEGAEATFQPERRYTLQLNLVERTKSQMHEVTSPYNKLVETVALLSAVGSFWLQESRAWEPVGLVSHCCQVSSPGGTPRLRQLGSKGDPHLLREYKHFQQPRQYGLTEYSEECK